MAIADMTASSTMVALPGKATQQQLPAAFGQSLESIMRELEEIDSHQEEDTSHQIIS
jgi:hypothetical protein